MTVIIGLMPALSIDQEQTLSQFALLPISNADSSMGDPKLLRAYRDLAERYAQTRGASESQQALLVQHGVTDPKDVDQTLVRAAVDCLAFAAVSEGRKHMLGDRPWPVLAFPEYFHLSPVMPSHDGGFISRTSALLSYASGTDGMQLFWPVERPQSAGHWDNNLVSALSGVVDRIFHNRHDHDAVRIVRSIELMVQATSASFDLVPGRAENAKSCVLAVSALETLCHPAKGDVNRRAVIGAIDALSFVDTSLNSKTKTTTTKGGESLRISPVGLVARAIYDVRNAYAHGDEIGDEQLCYENDETRTDLLRPTFFLFRKLVMASAANLRCIDFEGPPSCWTDKLDIDEGVELMSQFVSVADRRRFEEEFDELIRRLVTDPIWWHQW